MTDPVILVARRAGQPDRDAIWSFLREHWARHGWPIVEGQHDASEGLFNRSIATNRASAAAGDWKLAVILDADVWVEPWQVEAAVAAARTNGRLSFAHTAWWGLNRRGRQLILNGRRPLDPAAWGGLYDVKNPLSNSACMVVTRDLWEQVGGYDERFIGWGAEDWAWYESCVLLGGGENRMNAPLHHFHHEVSAESKAASRGKETAELAANHALGRRYLAARGERDAMLTLIGEAREHRMARA